MPPLRDEAMLDSFRSAVSGGTHRSVRATRMASNAAVSGGLGELSPRTSSINQGASSPEAPRVRESRSEPAGTDPGGAASARHPQRTAPLEGPRGGTATPSPESGIREAQFEVSPDDDWRHTVNHTPTDITNTGPSNPSSGDRTPDAAPPNRPGPAGPAGPVTPIAASVAPRSASPQRMPTRGTKR